MIITGITAQEFIDVVAKLNATEYHGNLVVEDARALSGSGRRINAKLATADSRAHGSRRSWSGRHGKWACWHAFRDVIRECMAVNPEAVVRTGMAVYKGSAGFEAEYPNTADRNAGSMVQPAYMPDMCVGHCAGDWE